MGGRSPGWEKRDENGGEEGMGESQKWEKLKQNCEKLPQKREENASKNEEKNPRNE